MEQNGKLTHKAWNKEASMSMVNVLAIAFKSGVYFLFAEMKSISPAYVPVFHEKDVRVITIVFGFEKAVIEARIGHQHYIIEVKRMSDCVFVK